MCVDNVAAARPTLTQNKGRGCAQDYGGWCGWLQLGHKATALVPGAPSSSAFVGCMKYPRPPSQPCRFPSCSYKTCFTEGINKTNTKSLPCQKRCRGTEPDHLWFIPPRPQLGDAGFGFAPGGPPQSSDQRPHRHTGTLPARTGLSSGTRSQGSPASRGSLGGPDRKSVV